jgi:hypothetical protein
MAQAGREVAANDWDYSEIGTAPKKKRSGSIDCTWRKIAITLRTPFLHLWHGAQGQDHHDPNRS